MKPQKTHVFYHWCRARRYLFVYIGVVFFCFFLVYSLYSYPWGVAGYAALLALAAGVVFAVADYLRFSGRHAALSQIAGRFPTLPLPDAGTLLEEDYNAIAAALEEERRRLEVAGDAARHDANEYYTLWAHQIKTPMAAMGLLLQSSDGGQTAALEQELFRIGQYVDMVLQYQRLSSINEDLLLQPQDIGGLVRKAARNCAPLFIHKQLSFSAEVEGVSVITDAKWFGFVLEQLYSNAVKYTTGGGVRVWMDGAHTLVVEDTGRGIPPEDLPRVFERGFTGHAGRNERSSTGIGLYLCRAVLARLGFGISITSTPGEGTRVLLHLHQEVLPGD